MRARALLAVLASASLLAGCGNSGDGGGSGSTETATLKVGLIPIADVAPLYLGMRKGFFAREHLRIEPQLAESGAAIVPAVVSGEDEVGFSNVGTMLVGQTKGLPIKVISQANEAAATPAKAWTSLLVKGSSDIREPKDLEGRTIALNGLHELNEVVVKSALAKEGVDVSRLKFTEVPFPDMVPALQAGRVDAISASEPFRTIAKQAGARVLLAPAVDLRPNMTFAVYFASERYIAQHRDVIERFQRAMGRSLDYAAAHEDEARAVIPTYSKVDKALAQKINLPVWTRDINRASIEMVAREGMRYGLLSKPPDLSQLIMAPPQG